MSAKMYRKKNLFEKLAPLWALVMMGLHTASVWYVFFGSPSIDFRIDYFLHIKYFIWIAVVAVSTWSFVPENAAAIFRHTLFYLAAGVVCVGAMYYYAFNIYKPGSNDDLLPELYAQYIAGVEGDYRKTVVKYAIEYTVYLSGAIAAFCAVKYKLSSSGWINKRVK